MSEKIYAWLLSLYPARFRDKYGNEALELFCNRSHEEKDFIPRLRLWLDVLLDLIISIPREHRRTQPTFAAAVEHRADGVPSFHVVHDEPLRPEAILFGGVLALVLLSVFLVLFNQVGEYKPSHNRMTQTSSPSSASSSTSAPLSKMSNKDEEMNRSEESMAASGNMSHSGIRGNSQQTQLPAVLALQQVSSQPHPQDATRAMVQLLHTHNIVMLGEIHGNQQEYEWLCKLVRTPEFADSVDDIVVEFGNSLYQQTVDRYISGENVPLDQVQKAWRNMVSSVPPVSPVYGWFYQAVREANMERHGKHRIRLLLASPPGDWDKIKNSLDLAPYENEREGWYAQVVKREVLEKHHRALLIMGAGHFLRGSAGPIQEAPLSQQHGAVSNTEKLQIQQSYIERELRAAGANPYLVVFGANTLDNQGHIVTRFETWPTPVIVPLSGNWLGNLSAQPLLTCGHAPATTLTLADEADAMLYVAPCAELKSVDVPRSELDGTPYGKEIARRATIILGLSPQQSR